MDSPIASAALDAAMEVNLVTHMSWLQARLPGARVLDSADLLLVDSGFETDTFNVVCRTRLAPSNLESRIEEALGYFEQANRPVSWWVGPLDQPRDLGESLGRAGLVSAEEEVGMVATLDILMPINPAPSGLRVERVTRREGVADFAQVVAANWSPPDPAVQAYYAATSSLLLRQEAPIRLYVGYLGKRPVATAELCVAGGIAGLYSVCTLRSERRQGFGSTLTARVMSEARGEGLNLAALQASAQGQRIYERLGFRSVSRYIEYKPRPHRHRDREQPQDRAGTSQTI